MATRLLLKAAFAFKYPFAIIFYVKALTHLEKLAQHFIEGPFGRLFKTRLHPIDLAKAMAKAMATGKKDDGQGGCLTPNFYEVTLNSQDYKTLQTEIPISEEIEAIKQYLAALMVEMGCRSVGPLDVCITPDPTLKVGDFQIKHDYLSIMGSTISPGHQQVDTKRFPKATYLPADHWWLQLPNQTIQLGMPLLKIGRALDNEVIISEPSVSRYHATLVWQNGFYYAQNLSRSQPLIVNFKPVEQDIRLKSKDRLQLGLVVLHIELKS